MWGSLTVVKINIIIHHITFNLNLNLKTHFFTFPVAQPLSFLPIYSNVVVTLHADNDNEKGWQREKNQAFCNAKRP